MTPDWIGEAHCRGGDVNLFFPERGKSSLVEKRVMEICRECPVKQKCLEYGLAQGFQIGYFGGVSAEGRRRILQSKKRMAA